MKYRLIDGRPGVYEGLKTEMLNGSIQGVRYINVVFGNDMIGECDDDVDMEHFIRDKIIERVVESKKEEKTEQIIDVINTVIVDPVMPDTVELNSVEVNVEPVKTDDEEKIVEIDSEEKQEEKKIIKRGRKPKALRNEK